MVKGIFPTKEPRNVLEKFNKISTKTAINSINHTHIIEIRALKNPIGKIFFNIN